MIFSKRYKDFVKYGGFHQQDNICGKIDDNAKKEIIDLLHEFDEPKRVSRNRYNNYIENTSALSEAFKNFSKLTNNITYNLSNKLTNFLLPTIFNPFLFDIIELQYNELSSNEKADFQSAINSVFNQYDIPWIIVDGQMIKIDSKQFEADLKRKAHEKINELKCDEPIFQSAYDEFCKAFECYAKGDYSETIANAEKSYESILKIICDKSRGNADKLTSELAKMNILELPNTMKFEGFREKVLMSLPYIRNNSGSSHGAGAESIKISKELANFSLNICSALNTFLIEEYKNSNKNL